MREPLENQRHPFEIPDGVAFFNCANVAPQLRSVRKAGQRALARNARPWEITSSEGPIAERAPSFRRCRRRPQRR